MKRLLYLLVLGAGAAVLILVVDMATREQDDALEQPPLEMPEEQAFDPPPFVEDKPFLSGGQFPFYETVTDERGNPVKVQTRLVTIGKLEPGEGNEFIGEEIRFILYDKGEFNKPLDERIIAKGSADRAKFFTSEKMEGLEFNAGIKPDFFVLKENIHVQAFNPGSREPSFSLKADDMVCREDRFDSTGQVTIYKEDLVITGEGLILDMKSNVFTLERNIHIEGRQFDFSDFASFREPEAPPDAGEKGRKLDAPLTVTAAGPLRLHLQEGLTGGTRQTAPEGEAAEKGLSRLEIFKDVVISQEDFNFTTDEMELEFSESAEGKMEVRSLKGVSREKRTTLRGKDFLVRCDDLFYDRNDGGNVFLLTGTPELDNVTVPLFSASGSDEGPQLLLLKCGDRMRISSAGLSGLEPSGYDVKLTGGVIITRKNDPTVPLLKSDTLSFVVTVKERPELPDNAPASTESSTPAFTVDQFLAEGEVSGRIEGFDLACSSLHYNYIESDTGYISKISLRDPVESSLSGEGVSLTSPGIDIAVYSDLVEITARETYLCRSEVENLPRVQSFDFFGGGAPPNGGQVAQDGEAAALDGERAAQDGERAAQDGGPGLVIMKGTGDFRLLNIEEKTGPRQTVTIEQGAFLIEAFRGETPVVTLEGNRSFSLDLLARQLSSLNITGEGKLTAPEMGFTAEGESLNLSQEDDGSTLFTAEGPDGSALVSLKDPNEPEPFRIHATRIDLINGAEVRLTAREQVNASFPLAMIQSGETPSAAAGGEDGEKAASGPATARCDLMVIERKEGEEQFLLRGKGDAEIIAEAMGLDAVCDTFDYHSEAEVLTLVGTADNPAVIRKVSSPLNPSVYHTLSSMRVDMNLGTSKVDVHEGGILILNPYDAVRNSFNRITIHCTREIALENDLLTFNGPVSMAYFNGEENVTRSLDCGKLWLYFEKSPLLTPVTSMDFETYKAMIKSGMPEEDEGSNRLKRIKAQENVTLHLETYSVFCSLLTWNLLKDEIIGDGLGKEIRISVEKQFTLRGGRVRLRPVNEEITILNR